MSAAILAIDAGGTAIKAALYGLDGCEIASAGEPLPALMPCPGHVERDADESWTVVCRCVRKVLDAADAEPFDVAAVGLTGYGNGLLLLDAAGRPVRPAILAPDQRAAPIVEQWRAAGLEAGHLALANQRLWAGKPLPLLAWLARHEPAALARAAHLVTCKDDLRFRLTGRIALEVSDASTSSLLDQNGRSFTDAVFAHLGLAEHVRLVPPLVEPLVVAGQVTATAAAATGLRAGTPVSAGFADGPAMLLGLGIADDSRLNVIAGTWGLNQLLTRTPTTDGSILGCTLGPRPGEYVLVDGGATSASAFEWFVETIRPAGPADRAAQFAWCDAAVAALECDDAAVYFLPYLNGRLDAPQARGTFVGLSSRQGLPHMARAVFEGVALEHRVHVEALLKGRSRPGAVRFAGGAARSGPWLDIFAATLDLPVEVSEANELGALGAAIIAATGAGLHADLDTAVKRMSRVSCVVAPDPRHVERMNRRFSAYRTLRNALDPVWAQL